MAVSKPRWSRRAGIRSRLGPPTSPGGRLVPRGRWISSTVRVTPPGPSSILTFLDTSTVTIAVDLLLDNVTVTPLFQCVLAPAGLIGWWKGDGNADDATGTNNGTPTDVSFINGEVGQCFYFNGTDSQI